MGNKNSMPASSAICASFKLFSQEASQRSGTLVTAIPPEQLGEKIPSFSLLPLNIVVRGLSRAPDINVFLAWPLRPSVIETQDYRRSIAENETLACGPANQCHVVRHLWTLQRRNDSVLWSVQ